MKMACCIGLFMLVDVNFLALVCIHVRVLFLFGSVEFNHIDVTSQDKTTYMRVPAIT